MLRLQDLVDKLQTKVKAYKRQAEEAVSISTGKEFSRTMSGSVKDPSSSHSRDFLLRQ